MFYGSTCHVSDHITMIVSFVITCALIVKFTTSDVIFAKEGSVVELQCPNSPVTSWSSINQDQVAVYTNFKQLDPRLIGKLSIDDGGNLHIHNFTGSDIKKYRCITTNGSHLEKFEFDVKATHYPMLLEPNTNFNVLVNIGSPVNISLKTGGYPRPTVSWTLGSGGVEGDWFVMTNSSDLASHTLHSSVLVQDISQLGPYKARIRNTEGTLDVTFILEIDKDSEVTILTSSKQLSCNATNFVKLKCILTAGRLEGELEWNHYHSGVFIRRLNSINNLTSSELEITYCNYQDVGEYVCSLSTNPLRLASTFLTVYGSPVVTKQDILTEENNITLIVKFISNPDIKEVKWFLNQQDINAQTNSRITLESATIAVSYYGIIRQSRGYVAKLNILPEVIVQIQTIDCLLQNNAGTRESFFTYKSIYEAIQQSTQTTESLNASKFNYSGSPKERTNYTSYLYIYLLIAWISMSLFFFMVFVAGKIAANLFEIRRRGMEKGQQVTEIFREPVNVPEVIIADRVQGDSEYEEIDNVSYDLVTWRDYALHSVDPRKNPNGTDVKIEENVVQEYINVNLYESLKERLKDENRYDEFET